MQKTNEPIVRAGYQHQLLKQLREHGQKFADLGREEAQARAAYDAAKYSAVLEMRTQGESATNINNMIRGRPEVNKAMLDYMILKNRREAAQEVINIIKLEIRMLGVDIH